MNMKMRSPLLLAVLATLLVACDTITEQEKAAALQSQLSNELTPHFGGNTKAFEELDDKELLQLQLVTTNLVTSLVQIPELRPSNATLQYSAPQSAFGNAVIRSLEDAGFGMQLVSADQGVNYVSYEKSDAQTDIGPVTRYAISVGNIRVSREYDVVDDAIFPSSLLTISGTRFAEDIELADDIFKEQGSVEESAFISGVQYPDNPDPNLEVATVEVRDYDKIPLDKRQEPAEVLNGARQRYFRIDSERRTPDIDKYRRFRRTVLIFDNADTRMLGEGNKQAIRLMVKKFEPLDLMVIKACQDADGRDESSLQRAIRVEEELASHELAPESTWIAPCTRTVFRHASDDSPAPVELIHYKPL
ncbi:MAG: hypothetical protein CSB44_04290 [Gammaproteobacteria bacterium]|nr:MAG: hypothetical protein CSB44_04290 [Gammaproteobacteria bacterium]